MRRRASTLSADEFKSPWSDPSYRAQYQTVVDLALRRKVNDLKIALDHGYDPRQKITVDGREWVALYSTNPEIIRALLDKGAQPLEKVNGKTIFRWHVQYFLLRKNNCRTVPERYKQHYEVIQELAKKLGKKESRRELKQVEKQLKLKKKPAKKEPEQKTLQRKSSQTNLAILKKQLVEEPSIVGLCCSACACSVFE